MNCSETDQIKDTLRIIKTRFKCRDCKITYTPKIDGIDDKSLISNQTKQLIFGDITRIMSFVEIGRRYNVSSMKVIQIFDDKVPYIPRGKLTIVLCIDEKGFNGALHIVDLFRAVQLLTRAVNKIRYNHVKDIKKSSPAVNFMKTKWKLFLCRSENIPDKWYSPQGYGYSIHYSDMVFDCVKKYDDLLIAYNILQDLYHYNRNDTFMESLKFINNLAERLKLTGKELPETVGTSYTKFRVEIANGLAKNQTGKNYSNGVAESINNSVSTIIKVSNGYKDFEIFRKRCMLISRYKKI